MITDDERQKYGNSYVGSYARDNASIGWPKNKEILGVMLRGAYAVGKQDGTIKTAADMREDKKALDPRVLDAICKLAVANAQLSESLSKALLGTQGNL